MAELRFSTKVPVTMSGATHVDVSVSYRKGGTNMWSGNDEPRGFELMLNPVTISPEGYVSFIIGNSKGRRVFLAPAARYNAKAHAALAAKVMPLADALAAAVVDGNIDLAAAAARTAAAA